MSFNNTAIMPDAAAKRLLSLDVMRGAIMLLLAAESCRIYESVHALALPVPVRLFVEQFFHHPWHGLRFWDLVQPAFMTIAGTALYLSYHSRLRKGITWQQQFRHVVVRCIKLFLCGTGLHCIYAGQMVWELWNVLTQLAVTTLIAYSIIRLPGKWQLLLSLLLLLLTELLYRNVLVPGFDQPFTAQHNFGAYLDTVLMGKINPDGWVAINFIPTAAHTIWGVLAGKCLADNGSPAGKVKMLSLAGVAGLIAGYGLDLLQITPIIKRISTSSFVLASGGWVLLIMAFIYWLTDIRKNNRYAWIASVAGMNAIFLYLFFETVGIQWLNGTVGIFTNGLGELVGIGDKVQAVLAGVVTLIAEWGLCYWLFKRGIFFKL